MTRFLIPALFLLIVFLMPESWAFAQIPLQVCEGNACNACKLVQLVNNVIQFLIFIAVLLGTLMFILAGFKFVTAGGNAGQIKEAKKMFVDVTIGMIIVLTGFLIVDTVMKVLVGNSLLNAGPWNEIQCVANPDATAPAGPIVIGPAPGTPGNVGTPGCPTCQSIEGIPCKHVSSCTVDPSYAQNLSQLSSYGLIITEAYPPTIQHQNACHSNGTCTDVAFADSNYSVERIQQFQAAAQAAGYRAVYEPGPSGPCPAGVSPCLAGVGTGAHFSLYKN